jgi:uncharacterized membrane protein
LDAPPANEPLLVVAPIDTVTTTTKRVRQVSRKEPSARSQYTIVVTSRLLVLIDVTTLILTAADIHGPLRLLFGLCLGLVIPGWCLVTPLKLDNAPLELGLILSVSLSLFMVVAQILMTMDLWHLVALEEISCLICLPFLLNQAKMVTMWSPRRATKAGPRHTKLPTAP